ncbi:lipoprotein, putative [Fulvimarina pelagi HTCC2506]|uniref:Lipoprotein, putative n=2 Tax=Fulvimarina pelagi TaxID=217511 RepID=Q0G179_9HYPH|nr:lipoprotein, putative [Fulvimarina pelagi HTCC2506]
MFLAACSSTDTGEGLGETAASVGAPPVPNGQPTGFATQGTAASYCPAVEVRQGTGILDKDEGTELAYSANIIGAQSTCRIVDGQLRMKVDVGGRIAPGPAAPGAVQLPLRIAVLRGDDVIYSELGRVPTSANAGGEAQNFTYTDDRIVFAEPKEQNIKVFTGFDEGPPG